jgi:hypothetical protein
MHYGKIHFPLKLKMHHTKLNYRTERETQLWMHIFTYNPKSNYVLKQIGPETNTLKLNIHPVGIATTQKP